MGKQNLKGDDDKPKLTPEQRADLDFKARQLAAQTMFLRWTSNFNKETIKTHPRLSAVKLLSPAQSARFCFYVENETIMLGVQPFEQAWMFSMPFSCAYISDMLYLRAKTRAIMGVRIPEIVIGFHVESDEKLLEMKRARTIQLVPVQVKDGVVVDAGRAHSLGIDVIAGDVISAMYVEKQKAMEAQDIHRFI